MGKTVSYSLSSILLFVALYACGMYNYLLFHSIAEIFSVVVAGAIFVITWNTRQYLSNSFFLFLGISYLFVGGLDLIHTLSYEGIAIFDGYNTDLATQLWVAARFLESLSLLAAFLFLDGKLRVGSVLLIFAAIFVSLLLAIFYWRIFPACFVEGVGLTPFKKISEYIVSFCLLASAALLVVYREKFDDGVRRWIMGSIGLSIISELTFTTYISAYGPANLLGHYFKILSFCCIYKALVETGLRKPYSLVFRELKQSEEQYRSLFTNMFSGFAKHKALFDENGKPVDYVFLQVNRAFEKITGLRGKNIIGKKVTEVLPGIAEDPADWIDNFGRVALSGEPIHMEQYAGPLNRWYSVSAYSPEKGFFVTVFDDISRRKQDEEALRTAGEMLEIRVQERTAELSRAKELFQTIIDNIPVMICLFDSHGDVRVLNNHYKSLIGWNPGENGTTDLAEAYQIDPTMCEKIWSQMKQREPGWKDIILHTTQGKELESSWATVELSDGSLIAIGIDITERKKDERERELVLQQLKRSNKELQDFAFVASHDLQEPLRKIQSFGDLLLTEFSDSIPEEGRDFLARMQNSATRMRVLIDSLLAYSRVTTKTRPFLQISLSEAVEEALGNLVVLREENRASVEVGELPIVEGDEQQMVQLFQNLVGNALKFHRKGESPKVKIHARTIHGGRPDHADAYEIFVEDNGIGFDESHLSRIFAPFQRLHGKSEYEGVGIGLAICRKIVERHHGHITAESRPDGGAVFIVTLPGKQT